MIITDVMDQIATQLDTISGLRVWAYPTDSPQAPAAIVTWPDSYTLDYTFVRGSDHMELGVIVLVERTPARVARNQLGAYCNGSGASSIKAVLEAGNGTYTAFHELRVMTVDFDVYSFKGAEYWVAIFSINVVGTGA